MNPLRRPSALFFSMVGMAAVLALGVAGPASGFSSYNKPPGGAWRIDSRLDFTKGGAMRVNSKKSRVTKLVVKVGGRYGDTDDCGKRVTVVSKPKIRSFRQFSGRWAFAGVKGGLLVEKGVKLKIKGRVVRGKLSLIFDRSGRVAEEANISTKTCDIRFLARKKR